MRKPTTPPRRTDGIKDTATQLDALAGAKRYFSARGARTTPARAKALLERLGTKGPVREEDRLDAPDENP
jgi:hypothetical protein